MDITHDDLDRPGVYNMAVAEVLRAERAAREVTISSLSHESGINSVTLQRLLKGKRPITVTQLFQLAGPLKVSPAEVMRRASKRLADR